MSSKGGKGKPDLGGSKGKGHNKNAGAKVQSDIMGAPRGVAKGKRSGEEVKPVAKIPQSRDDASSNWKALLLTKGKGGSSSKTTPQAVGGAGMVTNEAKDFKRFRSSSNSDASSSTTDVRSRSVSQTRSSSQISMVSETTSSTETDYVEIESDNDRGAARLQQCQKVKQEFRALGLLESKDASEHRGRSSRPEERAPRSLPTTVVALKKPPGEGLNDFGFFDYNHYGILRTPITPDHKEFMIDTGIIAMDCEMVGVGPMRESALARVSIVNEYGFCLYNKFVKPKLEVTDYRTQFSGIRENDLKNAVPFQIVTREVSDILRSHILVGHSLKSDLSVLFLSHQKARTRDTAMYFKRIFHTKTPKLKTLVKKVFGIDIQQGEHNSIVDAQAAMSLYRLYQKDWEISVRQSNRGINILKQTLDEFKEYGREYQPNQPQMDHQDNWYGIPEANSFQYNNTHEVEYPSASPTPPQLSNFVPSENYYASFNQVSYNLPYYPPPPPVPVPPLVHFNHFNTVTFPNYSRTY